MRFGWLLLLIGCVDKTDPRWQLDHDRIVVVRATPSHVPAGMVTSFDALVAHVGAPTDVETPMLAGLSPTAPSSLAGTAVAMDATGWHVTAPTDATLAAARAQLGLADDAAVPLDIVMSFGPIPLVATKTVYFGDAADNPTLGAVTLLGAPVAPTDSLVVPQDMDAPLTVDADDTASVNWLTSCGTMHDDDEHDSFVHVLPTDPMMGELAVVVRDVDGGVVWQVWPIHAQ